MNLPLQAPGHEAAVSQVFDDIKNSGKALGAVVSNVDVDTKL